MIRRLTILFAFAAAWCARAQQATEINGDLTEADPHGLKITGLRMTAEDLSLTADTGFLSADQTTVTAAGHVVLTYRAIRLLADKLVYHRDTGAFEAERVRLGAFPYFAEGESATGTLKEITLVHATATYGEPSPWHPTMVADKIIYAPGQRLRTENSRLGIGHAQFLPLPHATQSLHDPLIGYASLTGGFRRSLGVFAEAGLHLPTPNLAGLKLGGDIGVYTSRGVMFGPSGSYERSGEGEELRGWFRTGYINDHGDKKTDLLNRPVPENRGYVEWQHTQQLADNLSLNAQLEWWKDSEVLRDFRPRAFFPVQQPDTFAEATYAGKNYFVSLFTRLRPNSFERVQQRLPELRFDLLPTAIGGGFYERFSASAAMLREDQIPDGVLRIAVPNIPRVDPSILHGPEIESPSYRDYYAYGPDLRSTRLDAYYSLSRTLAMGDWFALTPVAGARLTRYDGSRRTLPASQSIPDPQFRGLPGTLSYAELKSLDSYTRTLGELGFDAALRTSGTFDYKNAQWKIDGLRHLFTPRLSYRYIPNADKGGIWTYYTRGRIPQIDRQTFATYLQPLGLGDQRNIDDLRATNTLRLGFDNTLQTRDPAYGSRDLLVFNVANDFRFKRAPGERTTSEIHAELGVTPARWLEASVYQSFVPQNFTLQELNTGVTLRDGDRWTVRFANNYLRRQIEDYAIDGRWRLHERFDALTRLHYDVRKRRFTEQAYGLVQNLDNTWRISYVVSLYEGRARESRFGLNLQIDAIGF